jgi:hypothetical protein
LDEESAKLLERNGGVVKGYVPRYEPGGKVRLVHWRNSARPRDKWPEPTEIPTHILSKLMDVPKPKSRTPRERMEPLVQNLLDQAAKSKAAFGYVAWPKSIAEEIKALGWKLGDPDLLKKTENAEVEAIRTYAGWLMVETAQKQREQDRKKVTLDWSGHYNA